MVITSSFVFRLNKNPNNKIIIKIKLLRVLNNMYLHFFFVCCQVFYKSNWSHDIYSLKRILFKWEFMIAASRLCTSE